MLSAKSRQQSCISFGSVTQFSLRQHSDDRILSSNGALKPNGALISVVTDPFGQAVPKENASIGRGQLSLHRISKHRLVGRACRGKSCYHTDVYTGKSNLNLNKSENHQYV